MIMPLIGNTGNVLIFAVSPWFRCVPAAWVKCSRAWGRSGWCGSCAASPDTAGLSGQTSWPAGGWSPGTCSSWWARTGSCWAARRSCRCGFERWSSPACGWRSCSSPCPASSGAPGCGSPPQPAGGSASRCGPSSEPRGSATCGQTPSPPANMMLSLILNLSGHKRNNN